MTSPIKVELQLDSSKFQSDLKNAISSLAGIETSAGKVATSVQKIESGSDKAAAGLRRMTSAGESFTGVLRDVSVITGAFSQAISVFSSISSGFLGDIVRVNSEMERLSYQMRAMSTASDPIKDAAESVAWLRKEAEQAPFSLKAITDAFVKMKAARLDPKGGMLKSFMDGLTAFGGTDEQLNRVSVAITQMAGKSVIQMEELRQQLGEHMPTAMQLMARSMGLTVAQLSKVVATGTLDARSSLKKLADEMERTYGGASYRMMQSFSGQMSQLKTNLQLLATDTGGNAFFSVIKDDLRDINEFLKSNDAKVYAQQFGQALANVAINLKNSLKYVWEYRDALLSIIKTAGGIYVVSKLSQLFSAFSGYAVGSLKNLKNSITEVRWGLTAIQDSFVGLKTGQSVFTSLQIGALGFGTALKGITASIPLIGLGILAIQGIVELFSNWESAADKAKRKTDEAYEAARNGSTRNYEETKRNIDAKIAELKNEEEIAKSKANRTYYYKWVYALNDAVDVTDNAQREHDKAVADFTKSNQERKEIEQEREAIEAEKKRQDSEAGARSVENILYSKNDNIEREYKDAQDLIDQQREAALSNAAKTGENVKDISSKYKKLSLDEDKKYYNNQLAILEEELKKQQSLLKKYSNADAENTQNGLGKNYYLGAIKKIKDLQDEIKKKINDLNPNKMDPELLASPVNNEQTRIKNGNKALLKLKETIFDLQGEISGATNAFSQMFAKVSAGKYGELDSAEEAVKRMHQELLQMAAEKTVFDKMREGFTGLQNDIDQIKKKTLDQHIQNVIRKEEADRGGIKLSETEKLKIAIREGKYFGIGPSSVIENQFDDLAKNVNSQTKLAATLGDAFRENAFGSTTIAKINDVKMSLDGVSNSLSGINGLANGIDIGTSLRNVGAVNNQSPTNNLGLSGPQFGPNVLGQLNSLTTGIAEVNDTLKGSANLMSKNMGRWGNPTSPNWSENNITRITTHNGKSVDVHKEAAASFLGFLNDLEEQGYQINSLGGYNLRTKRGGRSLSEHAFGNAIDINPSQNPMSKNFMTDMPANISELAAKWGLTWGGDWKNTKDPMHFEWTGRHSFLQKDATLLKSPELNFDPAKNAVLDASSNINANVDESINALNEKVRAAQKESFSADINELKSKAKQELLEIYNRPFDAGNKYDAARQSMLNNGEDPKNERNQRILESMRQLDVQSTLATKDQKLRNDMKEDELKLTSQIAEYNKKAANPNYQGQSQEIKNILLTYDQLLNKAEQLSEGKNGPVYKSIETAKRDAVRKQAQLELAQRKAATAQETQDIRDSLLTQSQLRQTQLQRDMAAVDEWAQHMRQNGADEIAITEEVEQKKANIRQKYAQQINPVVKQMREWADINDQIEKSETGWMDSLAGGIAGVITGAGNLRSVIDGIINDITKIGVKGLLSSLFGGQKVSLKSDSDATGSAAKSMFTKSAAVHHGGGMVGDRGAFRSVSALAFLGAPKMHGGGIVGGGLLPSEVPIIAKKGEAVLTPEQMRAAGSFQQNRLVQIQAPITVNGSAGSPEQNEDLAKRMSKELDGTMRAIIADEMRKQSRPGSFLNNRSR